MTSHSFVDESKHGLYLLVAVLIQPAMLARTRRELGAMVLPGQRRIHFYKERDDRRSMIANRLADLPAEAVIYQVSRSDREARDRCLTALIRDHLERNVQRLVLERDDSRVDSDRRLMRQAIRLASAEDRFAYSHLRAHEEPLLSFPDAIAWCWTHGGHWRAKVKGMVTEVFHA